MRLLFVLEVCFVPTAALQAEAGGRDLLADVTVTALRAAGRRRLVEPLQAFELVPAIGTNKLVNWHCLSPGSDARTVPGSRKHRGERPPAAHDYRNINENTAFSRIFGCLRDDGAAINRAVKGGC